MVEQGGVLEISRGRVLHNVGLLRGHCGVGVCGVIKADGYGHGMGEVTEALRRSGVEWAAVYSVAEGVRARGLGWEKVLVMAPVVGEGELEAVVRAGVRVNVVDAETAGALAAAARGAGEIVRVHVQVDTGLTRGGVAAEAADGLLAVIAGLEGLMLEGVFAHFSHGEERGSAATAAELARFAAVVERARGRWPQLMAHLQNSGAGWQVAAAGMSFVRMGIAMYGLQPSMAERIPGLKPVARVVAPVLAIHEVEAGVGVGYGHLFVTPQRVDGRRSRIAVVPVGYAEGYPRRMTGKGVVQVRGRDVPVVGRVSMDQITVDVTEVAGVSVGDQVTVISWEEGAANSVDEIARATATIGYEVATGFGGRLRRRVVE